MTHSSKLVMLDVIIIACVIREFQSTTFEQDITLSLDQKKKLDTVRSS
jgi:hypothetical protein